MTLSGRAGLPRRHCCAPSPSSQEPGGISFTPLVFTPMVYSTCVYSTSLLHWFTPLVYSNGLLHWFTPLVYSTGLLHLCLLHLCLLHLCLLQWFTPLVTPMREFPANKGQVL